MLPMANEPDNSNKNINKIIKTSKQRPQTNSRAKAKKTNQKIEGNYKNVSVQASK